MTFSNLHTHTKWSDGSGTVGETVEAAIAKGFTSIGISDHSIAPLGLYLGIDGNSIAAYLSDIRAVAQKYGGQIEVYAGIENEFCNPLPAKGFDYVIGSVHYMRCGGGYYCNDNTYEELQRLTLEVFGGDYYRLARKYFELTAEMAVTQKPDIIGHFDIITKFNRVGRYLDTRSEAYIKPVKSALDVIARTDCIIEVNTGAIARGYADEPYPEWHILSEIREMGIPVTLSSDAHRPENLDFAFTTIATALKEIGFTHIRQLINGGFEDVEL